MQKKAPGAAKKHFHQQNSTVFKLWAVIDYMTGTFQGLHCQLRFKTTAHTLLPDVDVVAGYF